MSELLKRIEGLEEDIVELETRLRATEIAFALKSIKKPKDLDETRKKVKEYVESYGTPLVDFLIRDNIKENTIKKNILVYKMIKAEVVSYDHLALILEKQVSTIRRAYKTGRYFMEKGEL